MGGMERRGLVGWYMGYSWKTEGGGFVLGLGGGFVRRGVG